LNYSMKLIVGQIALDGATAGTIKFFRDSYALLNREGGSSCKEMATAALLTRQHARRHIAWLESQGCVKRIGFRAWKLSDKPLTDPEYVMLARVAPANLEMFGGKHAVGYAYR